MTVVGVWDVDGVIVAAFWVVGDETDWCFVDLVVGVGGFVFIVDGAFSVWKGYGSNCELWSEANGGNGVAIGRCIGNGGDRG